MSWEVLLAPQTKSFKEFMNMIQYNLSAHGCVNLGANSKATLPGSSLAPPIK